MRVAVKLNLSLLLIQQVKVPQVAVEKWYYEMLELVGFQTMVILDPNGMTFDTVGVFGQAFHLLFKPGSSYYGMPPYPLAPTAL